MKRSDVSSYLYHWVSGENKENAFKQLSDIVSAGKILANNSMIKGGYFCICFTETPIQINFAHKTRYSSFGFRFKKKYIFNLGGRPVIYQPDSEYDLLPEELRWRHVRYELDKVTPIDFTWEREWRIQIDELKLDPYEISIVVPNKEDAQELERRFDEAEIDRYIMECLGYGDEIAEYPKPLVYKISPIDSD